jgi:hypothetical protein
MGVSFPMAKPISIGVALRMGHGLLAVLFRVTLPFRALSPSAGDVCSKSQTPFPFVDRIFGRKFVQLWDA